MGYAPDCKCPTYCELGDDDPHAYDFYVYSRNSTTVGESEAIPDSATCRAICYTKYKSPYYNWMSELAGPTPTS